ncbi:MAG: Hpt domain-containing protein [Chloroflexota bacterium]
MDQKTTLLVRGVLEQHYDTIVSRIRSVDSALRLLADGALDPAVRENALVEAHRLAGTLAIFEIGDAEALFTSSEQVLQEVPQDEAGARVPALRGQIQTFLRQLSEAAGQSRDGERT